MLYKKLENILKTQKMYCKLMSTSTRVLRYTSADYNFSLVRWWYYVILNKNISKNVVSNFITPIIGSDTVATRMRAHTSISNSLIVLKIISISKSKEVELEK